MLSRAWALLIVLPLASTPSAADPSCACPAEGAKGLFWMGARLPELKQVVEMIAPVLWYTADEPAIVQGDVPLPQVHPCDPVKKDGVLYYQVNSIVLSGTEGVNEPVEEDPRFLDKAAGFGIRFYFYHRWDYGMNGHRHDLEMAELRVAIDRDSAGCRRLRLTNVIGFAHNDWYSNELVVETDTKLPLHLLIEEGKHASGPDRNADGNFTPGYDINTHVHDAWGVRDVFGSGYLLGSGYSSDMYKPRLKPYRAVPNAPQELACVPPHLRSLEANARALNRYELRPGYRIGKCETENREHLEKYTKKNEFGDEYRARQMTSELTAFFAEPLAANRGWFPKFSVRYDRSFGAAFTFNGIDLKEVYIVPKLNLVSDNSSVEALFTQSATAYASPYLTLGYGKSSVRIGEPHASSGLVAEAGFKLRLAVDWPWRLLGAGYEFAGIRMGLRTSGFNHLNDLRFITEFGAGLW